MCECDQVQKYAEDINREYYRCDRCELIFVPERYHLSRNDEKLRYDLHDNSAGNSGYVNYLNRIVEIVPEISRDVNAILDFGSGWNAVLTELLKGNGYQCVAYDPLYDKKDFQSKSFDIVIICEVIEHLRSLRQELSIIADAMSNGSFVLIRTQLSPPKELFQKWWYIQDKTHINFFSLKSIEQAGYLLGCVLEKTFDKDIFVLRKL